MTPQEIEALCERLESRIARLEELEHNCWESGRNAFLIGVDAGAFGLVEPSMTKEESQRSRVGRMKKAED